MNNLSLLNLSFEEIIKNDELYCLFSKIVGEIEFDRIIYDFASYLKFKKFKNKKDLFEMITTLEKYPELSKLYYSLYFNVITNKETEMLEFIWKNRLFNWASFIKRNELLKSNNICYVPIIYQQICIMMSYNRIENLRPTLDIGSIENFKVACYYGMDKIARFLYRRMCNPCFSNALVDVGNILKVGEEYYSMGNDKKSFCEFLRITNEE